MIVKVFVAPVQPTEPFVNKGVTAMVAITGFVFILIAVKDGMFPVPEAARPMPG